MLWGWDRLAKGIYRSRAAKFGFVKYPRSRRPLSQRRRSRAEGARLLPEGPEWICDGAQPTFADIDLFGFAIYAGEAGLSLDGLTHLQAWIKRIEALPGYRSPGELLPKGKPHGRLTAVRGPSRCAAAAWRRRPHRAGGGHALGDGDEARASRAVRMGGDDRGAVIRSLADRQVQRNLAEELGPQLRRRLARPP